VYRALIVCNSRFPDDPGALGELQGPKVDGVVFRDALIHHETGMFDRNDVRILNEGNSKDVGRFVEDFFGTAEPDDTLLFYYSGHGRTKDQHLFLCAQDTIVDRLYTTAIPSPILNGIVSASYAQVKILVLDCCHSGMLKGDAVIESLSGTGRYIVAATSATDRANDSSRRGMPSPFTELLAKALLSGAEDRDKDGQVDLDDVYNYLKSVPFRGPRPHRIFDGAGAVPIARRTREMPPELASEATNLADGSDRLDNDGTLVVPVERKALSYLDSPAVGSSFSPKRVAEFRELMRDDIVKVMPRYLSANEFLQQAGFVRDGQLTYAGLLLFSDNPTAVLPSAMVQCVRFYGNAKTDTSESVDLQGSISEMIVLARDFVADLARFGEKPTTEGAYAETVYRYPMIAVREIIANAVVHRDYENQDLCVQILVFTDRIEIISPGEWGGSPKVAEGQAPIGQLERQSQRRNFRLARTLTWSRLVEGVGAGIPRVIADCQAAGAPEPLVINGEGMVTVTVFPRSGLESTIAVPSGQPAIWGTVPSRNTNFAGREEAIDHLRRQLTAGGAAALVPQTLHGLGGVGKTQMAIEYAHRFAGDYEIVWWVPSDQPEFISSALAGLAPRLGISGLTLGRAEESASAVVDALRRGKPYGRWLLIFDNADQPELVRKFMPTGPGHIIVTSRNPSWARVAGTIEVEEFTRTESCAFLTRRIPDIETQDAERLAETLGDLPLALDQAASMLLETGMTVETYLRLLDQEGSRILAEAPSPGDYPHPVAAAWSLATSKIRADTPYAMDLLQLFAFFGPSPIPLEWFRRGRYVVDSPLRETLSDPILMARAIRALSRYALVRVDNSNRTVQMHRIIQRLIREELDMDNRRVFLHEAHRILAAADPSDPNNIENWSQYEDILAHFTPTQTAACSQNEVRQLTRNVVDYLYVTGNFEQALNIADQTLWHWNEDSGPSDADLLVMERLKIQVLRSLGRYQESYDLAISTMARMQEVFGPDHEETLILMSGSSTDFRARGDFLASLRSATDALARIKVVFGDDHPRTFEAMTSVAEDLELNSRYSEAEQLYKEIDEGQRASLANGGNPTTIYTQNALARTMREHGQYYAAVDKAERVNLDYREVVKRNVLSERHPWVLQAKMDLSVALQATGRLSEGFALATDTLEKYILTLGREHPSTLVAAINLGNALRVSNDVENAAALMEDTRYKCRSVLGGEHPYSLVCTLNLAIIQSCQGNAESAQQLLRDSRELLASRIGLDHHFTLACSADLATTCAQLGDTEQAVELGEEALRRFQAALGEGHPHTLACAANLALDLKALGQEQRAVDMRTKVVQRFEQVLVHDHPEVRAAEEGQRLMVAVNLTPMF
jgi:tetratricopeptide (TPR) repeat protein